MLIVISVFLSKVCLRGGRPTRWEWDLSWFAPAHEVDFCGNVTLAAAHIFRNFENILADLCCALAVSSLVPDLPAIARLGPVGLFVTGQEEKGAKAQFVYCYFAPGAGIPEEPVTGSIHATLVPYWASRLVATVLLAIRLCRVANGLIANLQKIGCFWEEPYRDTAERKRRRWAIGP